MKPAPFAYHAPGSLEEAIALLSSLEDSKVLAGGQSLVPLLNFRLARPAHLVDINRIPGLDGIYERDGGVAVQALVRHADALRSDALRRLCPLVPEALQHVAHAVIRNRGTVVGSIAHADPAAELPAAFAALDATFHVRSKRGSRIIGWNEFFVSEFTTALAPDELVTAVEVPALGPRTGTGFVEFARRHGDFAVGGAAATVTLGRDGGHGRSQWTSRGVLRQGVRVVSEHLIHASAVKMPKRESTVLSQNNVQLTRRFVVPARVVENPGRCSADGRGKWIQLLRATLMGSRLIEPSHRGEK